MLLLYVVVVVVAVVVLVGVLKATILNIHNRVIALNFDRHHIVANMSTVVSYLLLLMLRCCW